MRLKKKDSRKLTPCGKLLREKGKKEKKERTKEKNNERKKKRLLTSPKPSVSSVFLLPQCVYHANLFELRFVSDFYIYIVTIVFHLLLFLKPFFLYILILPKISCYCINEILLLNLQIVLCWFCECLSLILL